MSVIRILDRARDHCLREAVVVSTFVEQVFEDVEEITVVREEITAAVYLQLPDLGLAQGSDGLLVE